MSRLWNVNKIDGPLFSVGNQTISTAAFDVVSEPPTPLHNVVIHAEGILIGKDEGNFGCTMRLCRAFSIIAGVLAPLGTRVTVVGSNGSARLSSADGDIVASANSIVLQASGVANRTIEWTGFLTIWSGEFA